MPTAEGKFFLEDFVNEMKLRGFDGYSPADLTTYVNRGYFAVAKKSRWEWERHTVSVTLTPGDFAIDVSPKSTDVPNFKSLERIYMTTVGHSGKLMVMQDDDFFNYYLGLDLTSPDNRNEPSKYHLYDEKIYILSPPVSSRTFTLYYFRRPTWLIVPFDEPITPQHLDEAIIDAARVRAHTRANEPTLASVARSDLEEAFDDMRDEEEEDMHEMQERTSPDNTWL